MKSPQKSAPITPVLRRIAWKSANFDLILPSLLLLFCFSISMAHWWWMNQHNTQRQIYCLSRKGHSFTVFTICIFLPFCCYGHITTDTRTQCYHCVFPLCIFYFLLSWLILWVTGCSPHSILIILEPNGTLAPKFKPTWVIFSTGSTWKYLPKVIEAEKFIKIHQIEEVSMKCFQQL